MKFLSDNLLVKFDGLTGNVLVYHPDKSMFPSPLVTIRPETLDEMEFNAAAHFLGTRLLLLMPGTRERFQTHIANLRASDDGNLD